MVLLKWKKKTNTQTQIFLNQILTSHWTQIYFPLFINDNKKGGTTIFEVLQKAY
jgi:hypothetical protein